MHVFAQNHFFTVPTPNDLSFNSNSIYIIYYISITYSDPSTNRYTVPTAYITVEL